jgi:hypothetical protein
LCEGWPQPAPAVAAWAIQGRILRTLFRKSILFFPYNEINAYNRQGRLQNALQ